MNSVKVTVCCITYNHEKYLRNCLDSLISQETTFDYEILIHDDASTDGTSDIIKEYSNKFSNIKSIIQTENKYSKGISPLRDILFPLAKGKYIAMCEGDDFWCDRKKLQKQYEIMESNNELSWCTHLVKCVEENGNPTEKYIPDISCEPTINEKEYSSVETISLFSDKGFQLSSYFIRLDSFRLYFENTPEFVRISPTEDEVIVRYLAQSGNMYFINEIMSCYRMNAVGSWTTQTTKSDAAMAKQFRGMCNMLTSYDKFTGYKYSNIIKRDLLNKEWKLYYYSKDYRKMLNKKFKHINKNYTLITKIKFFIKSFLINKINGANNEN